MPTHIKCGLNIPISGKPNTVIEPKVARTVAVLGVDYLGLKPRLLVKEGDMVHKGSPLIVDKRQEQVQFTAPVSGKVVKINRGYRRVLESIVIEPSAEPSNLTFAHYLADAKLSDYSTEQVKSLLLESGLWSTFRTRPYSYIPAVEQTPHSIFVTATDTNPLAANPNDIIALHSKEFTQGLAVLSELTSKVFLCCNEQFDSLSVKLPSNKIHQEVFTGVHPAGLAGTHIHYLDSVGVGEKTVWTIGYQDVIAIGYLFGCGELFATRYISLAGPSVKNPRILKVTEGASLTEITAGEVNDERPNRVISGSVLNGRTAVDSTAYLGKFHYQVTVLTEGTERPVLHYMQAGRNRFSALPIYISSLLKKKEWDFTTTTNGSDRAMVPIGAYEQVMPLDILPTHLLRSIIVEDTEAAVSLGALELDEEDLALCTFVCPGKYEYGSILRNNLDKIAKEG